MNSGVCVRGSTDDDPNTSFYGILNDILVIQYVANGSIAQVILFEAEWFDPTARGTRIHPQYNLVDVNPNRKYPKYDPFVLAQQGIQVYYARYPGAPRSRANLMAVCESKSRRVIVPLPSDEEVELEDEDLPPLQNEEIQVTPNANTSTDGIELFDMAGINLVVDLGEYETIPEDDGDEQSEDDEEISGSDDDDEDAYSDGPNDM